MCSELTPRARIPDTRIPQLMQPCSVNTRVAVVRFAIRQLASSYICFWSAIDLKGIACLRQATNIKDVYLKRQTVAMVANDAKHTVGTSISTVTLWTRRRRHNGDVIALPAWSSGPRAVRTIWDRIQKYLRISSDLAKNFSLRCIIQFARFKTGARRLSAFEGE